MKTIPKLRAIMPSGKNLRLNTDGSYIWKKRGGYIDNTQKVLYSKLERAGFKEDRSKSIQSIGNSISADGWNSVACNQVWVHPTGASVSIRKYIGDTKRDNSYTIIGQPAQP